MSVYKYILKQLKRGVVLNAAFCLLLALAGTLMSLGAGLLVSARNGAEEADEMFTTIALPDASAIRQYATNQVKNLNEYETDYAVLTRDHAVWGEKFDQYAADHMADSMLKEIEDTVYSSPLVKLDPRRFFGAYSYDIVPLNKLDKDTMWYSKGTTGLGAAFVAKCVEVTEFHFMNAASLDQNRDMEKPVLHKSVRFDFEIEEIISLHPGYEKPAPVSFCIEENVQQPDGSYLYKEGGRYLISTYYLRYFSGTEPNVSISHGTYGPGWSDVVIGTVNTIEELDELDAYNWTVTREAILAWDGVFPLEVRTQRMDDEPSFFPVVELGGMSYEEALKSELGNDIKAAVAVAEKANHHLHVITTENINSYFNFNQHRAMISDGREFTDEETESGARVCLISRELAYTNGIKTGDIIQLTTFPSHFNSMLIWHDDNPYRSYRRFYTGWYFEGLPESEPMEFEVVGLFTAGGDGMPKDNDSHAIPLNTIFVPDKSVEGFPDYTRLDEYLEEHSKYNPFLNVIVVENGKNEEFRETVNSIIPGYGNFFKIYDQGYSAIKAAIENLVRNGTLIMILSAAGWVITLVVFCLFFVLRKKKDAGLLYAIGVKRKDCFRWVFAHCLAVILVAQLVAFGASFALHEATLEYAYKTAESGVEKMPWYMDVFSNANIAADGVKNKFEIARNPLVVLGAAGAQTLILLAVAGVMSSALINNGKKSLRGIDL